MDHFRGRLASVSQLHRYLYAGGDPIQQIDPSGYAFFAFDGTNNDEKDAGGGTNVYKMQKYSKDPHIFYSRGVGNGTENKNWGWGDIGGDLFGSGGDANLDEAWDQLIKWYNGIGGPVDQTIDIVGFSRGASEALEFANRIADGIPVYFSNGARGNGFHTNVKIRFIGLFDVVGSWGYPGLSPGKRQSLPTNITIQKAVHARAADERREFFPATNVVPSRSGSEASILI